ncbi:MAG: ABC transporter substrate-binding protein [Oscillospiraceae bacterium]|nr:ABC transporter substrate-binding protein [Oscillospiraceae bacterium]
MKLKRLLCLILALTMVVGLTACGSSSSTASTDSGTAASSGDSASADTAASDTADTIIIGRAYDSVNLDPVVQVGNYNIWILDLMLEGLVQSSDDGSTVEPCLATDWTISDDGLTYTFNLKEGLCFSDGTEVTGEDWVFSFERAMSMTEESWYFTVENIDSVEAPDDTTFVIHLKEVSAATLPYLCMWTCGVQSKDYYDEVGDEGYVNGFIGTGPYYLADWSKGTSMTFEANPYYHVEGQPATQTIIFRVIADDTSRIMQLQSGDIDAAINLSMDSLYQLESDDRVVVDPTTSCETRFLALNTSNEYLANEKVRQALTLATDTATINNVATYGYGELATTVLPTISAYIDPSITVTEQDIEAAKALLEEAGYGDGFTLDLMICSGKTIEESVATLVKEQWAQIGVDVNICSYERVTYTDNLYGLNFDVVVDYWTDDICDPSEFMAYLCDFDLCSGFDTNYEVEGIYELNLQANLELDDDARKEIYYEIQQKIADAYIYIPLFTIPYANAESTSIVNFIQTPLGNLRLANMYKTEG